VRHGKNIAAGQQLAQAAQIIEMVLNHQTKQPRGQPQRRYAMSLERQS